MKSPVRSVASGVVLLLAGMTAWSAILPTPADVDLVISRSGRARAGEIVGLNEKYLRIKVKLREDQPAAIISIPRREVIDVHFASPQEEEQLLIAPKRAQIPALRRYWQVKQDFVGIENSNAGGFALALAELLLASGKEEDVPEAEALFMQVEERDWLAQRRARGLTGKLRAMVASGRAKDALAEAETLAVESEDPSVIIEARYVMGNASLQALELLLEENPRWHEDERVRPERDRLYQESLDLLLYPYLFFGTESRQSARGLWQALNVYCLVGEDQQARAIAEDIVTLYAETPEAELAGKFLAASNKTSGGKG